jgi:signal transduction histidine kinase/CheY-like chemotaxis protein
LSTNTTRVARLAGFGLGTVLVLLAAFAVTASLLTSRAAAQASEKTALSAAYERARFAVGEEESLERKYRLEPGPEIRVKYQRAVADVLAAIRVVGRTGDSRDRVVARHVLDEHRPYLAAIGRMFAAVDRHDALTVLRIDANEVDPSFGEIETSVREAAARHRSSAASALHHSAAVSRGVVWLAPVVFMAGMALLGILWTVRRRDQRAATDALDRRNALLSDQAEQLRRTLHERRLAEGELAETQERLRHGQRLESIGQLAGGVAHDFNNLLQIILGYCGLIEMKPPTEDTRRELAEVAAAAGRGADLTGQLLAFGRRQALNPAVWDVNEITANVESMLTRVLPSHIDFKALPSADKLRTRVDRGQLEQVILNLVLNARDAMPDGGTLTLFAEPHELDVPMAIEDVELPAGSYVRIVVRDTGCGMSEETQARAFEPFFTTKERGRGTGLGLATVYGIVRQSGGFVSLRSILGAGTEVAICLPRTSDPAATAPSSVAIAPPKGARVGKVLLVEDEAEVRAVLAAYLREQGYDVLTAEDGREGLEVFHEHRDEVTVVVTDIVMPRLDGWGLVTELRRLGESIPIVVISGYAGEGQSADDERLVHLMKPFAPADILPAIAHLLPHTGSASR